MRLDAVARCCTGGTWGGGSDSFIKRVVLIFRRGLLVRNRFFFQFFLLYQFLGCLVRLMPELFPFLVVVFRIAMFTAP